MYAIIAHKGADAYIRIFKNLGNFKKKFPDKGAGCPL